MEAIQRILQLHVRVHKMALSSADAYCWHLCLWLGQCSRLLGSDTTEMLGFAGCLNDYDKWDENRILGAH